MHTRLIICGFVTIELGNVISINCLETFLINQQIQFMRCCTLHFLAYHSTRHINPACGCRLSTPAKPYFQLLTTLMTTDNKLLTIKLKQFESIICQGTHTTSSSSTTHPQINSIPKQYPHNLNPTAIKDHQFQIRYSISFGPERENLRVGNGMFSNSFDNSSACVFMSIYFLPHKS